MKQSELLPVTHPDFSKYGKVIDDQDFSDIVDYLRKNTEVPEGSKYVASDELAELLPIFQSLTMSYGGGLGIQIGWCNGTNRNLAALEYHNSGEVNVSCGNAALLLATMFDMVGDTVETSKVRGFLIEDGQAVLLYPTTLHYAPCAVDDAGFRMGVVLPRGTNTQLEQKDSSQPLLWMKNKWLIAHADTARLVDAGAYIGLLGEYITLERD